MHFKNKNNIRPLHLFFFFSFLPWQPLRHTSVVAEREVHVDNAPPHLPSPLNWKGLFYAALCFKQSYRHAQTHTHTRTPSLTAAPVYATINRVADTAHSIKMSVQSSETQTECGGRGVSEGGLLCATVRTKMNARMFV